MPLQIEVAAYEEYDSMYIDSNIESEGIIALGSIIPSSVPTFYDYNYYAGYGNEAKWNNDDRTIISVGSTPKHGIWDYVGNGGYSMGMDWIKI